jgi:hypothetical protein
MGMDGTNMTEINDFNRGDWMATFTGRRYYPLHPRRDEVFIEDIGHHLSLQCRYAGACKDFYSTAEHSYWLSTVCEEELKALLHDTPEAYLSDIVRPLKHTPEFDFYREVEYKNELIIASAFGFEDFHSDEIKAKDTRIIADEVAVLFDSLPEGWYLPVEPLGITIQCWSPKVAEQKFLERYYELTK